MSTEPVLRPATAADLPALADVHLAARAAAGPAFPPAVHPDDEVRAWVRGWDLSAYDVRVADLDGRIAGYSRATPTWLDDLYVAPEHAGQGIGSMLLDLAKSRRPDGFSLWVFESNTPARAFYAAHGLTEREHTDGSDNEEQAPDLRMSWP